MDGPRITFDLNAAGQPVKASGERVTCDGCGVELDTQPTAEQQSPIPLPIVRQVYLQPGQVIHPGQFRYVACKRGVDCLTLALLWDELYARNMCTDPFCDGTRCGERRLLS